MINDKLELISKIDDAIAKLNFGDAQGCLDVLSGIKSSAQTEVNEFEKCAEEESKKEPVMVDDQIDMFDSLSDKMQ